MKLKTFSIEEIWDTPVHKLIELIKYDHYSITKSLCHEQIPLQKRIAAKLFRIFFNTVWLIHRGDTDHSFQNRRTISRKIAKFLFRSTPVDYIGAIPSFADCLVAEYNMKSLGDTIRLVAYALNSYVTRVSLFVIDIADYELIAPLMDRFEMLGIYFCPIMTDSSYYMLNESAYKSPHLSYLRDSLYENMVAECGIFATEWCSIWIPFDMTVRNSLFNSEDEYKGIIPVRTSVVSDVVKSVLRNEKLEPHLIIIAVSILTRSGSDDDIGLHKHFQISFGETYNAKMANCRDFDYQVLKSIANAMFAAKDGTCIFY